MEQTKAHIGGEIEPFWRHFNTQTWEPEWRSLVDVLEREHLSVDWRIALERLRVGVGDASDGVRVTTAQELLGYLEDMRRCEQSEALSVIFVDMLERSEWDVIGALIGIALDDATSQQQMQLYTRALRGVLLFAASLRPKIIGATMGKFLSRLLDAQTSSEVKVEILELLLVVLADNQECQRDFMRRNGVTTVCALYTNSRGTDEELFDRARAFIGVYVEGVLPSGASAALSDALLGDAIETLEDAIGVDEKNVIVEAWRGKLAV